MSRFNKQTVNTQRYSNKLVNNRTTTGQGFAESDEMKLAGIVFTSFCNDEYYRTHKQATSEMFNLINILPEEFCAKVTHIARKEYGLRSITHMMTAALAPRLSGKEWAKDFFQSVIIRPDDMLEILSLMGGKPTHAMKKAFKNKLESFDEYQLAKYAKFARTNQGYNLNDLVRITHASTDNSPVLKNLIYRTLKNTDTWEAKGNNVEGWMSLLSENKLPYLALLRNLRNIAEHSVDELTSLATQALTNEVVIKKARIFPFQYMTAFQTLKEMVPSVHVNKMLEAISDACDISLMCIPNLDGVTVILIDQSGSMCGNSWGSRSAFGSKSAKTTASLFSAALANRLGSNAIVAAFASRGQTKFINGLTQSSTLASAENIYNGAYDGGTDFCGAFDMLKTNKIKCDRLIILTDEQHWITHSSSYSNSYQSFLEWTKSVNIDPKVWSIDLAGLGTTQFPTNKVCKLYGFSEKIFNSMEAMELDKTAFLQKINNVTFV